MRRNYIIAGVVLIAAGLAGAFFSPDSGADPYASKGLKVSHPRQKISPEDRRFLMDMKANVPSDAVADKLDRIIRQLDNSTELEADNYNFLIKIADLLKSPKISDRLREIAKKYSA